MQETDIIDRHPSFTIKSNKTMASALYIPVSITSGFTIKSCAFYLKLKTGSTNDFR